MTTLSAEPRRTGQRAEPRLIDSHAHMDDPVFDGDRALLLDAAKEVGIAAIINVGYRLARWGTTRQLISDHSPVFGAFGVHPAHADEWSEGTATRLREIASAHGKAIGEIGLDLFRPGPSLLQQQVAFSSQLDLALDLGLPVIIHQRAAERELLTLLEARDTLPRGVLHSFEGSATLARFACERDWLVGVGGLAIKPSAAELRSVLANVPLDRILIETDSPYLAPLGSGDRRNVPGNLPIIAERAAPIWSVDVATLAAQTSATARAFFSLACEDEP